MLGVNAVFAAHYLPLEERRAPMEDQFSHYNIAPRWITSEPSEEEVRDFYDSREVSWKTKVSRTPYPGTVPFKTLNEAEISLAYKHLKIYEQIVEEDIPVSLVLEDDALFEDDFAHKFNFNLAHTPRDWDFIFIGSGCDLRISPDTRREGQVAYLKEHPASKCTDSYVITKKASEKILETLTPLSFPIDFELNYQMCLHDMRVYWWDPPIIRQGSQCGMFRSTVQ